MNPIATEQNMQPSGVPGPHSHKTLIIVLILCILLAGAFLILYPKIGDNPISGDSKCGSDDTKCLGTTKENIDNGTQKSPTLTKAQQDSITKAFMSSKPPIPKSQQDAITNAYTSKSNLSPSDIDKITKANTGK